MGNGGDLERWGNKDYLGTGVYRGLCCFIMTALGADICLGYF